MLAKKVQKRNGRDWDLQLPCFICILHIPTGVLHIRSQLVKALSFSMVGDPVLPTTDMLTHIQMVDIDDYKLEMIASMSSMASCKRPHLGCSIKTEIKL